MNSYPTNLNKLVTCWAKKYSKSLVKQNLWVSQQQAQRCLYCLILLPASSNAFMPVDFQANAKEVMKHPVIAFFEDTYGKNVTPNWHYLNDKGQHWKKLYERNTVFSNTFATFAIAMAIASNQIKLHLFSNFYARKCFNQ